LNTKAKIKAELIAPCGLENLKNIEELGIRAFVRNEKVRWVCSDCGGLICVHRGSCSNCGKGGP